jgi:uncharacterized membrane protein
LLATALSACLAYESRAHGPALPGCGDETLAPFDCDHLLTTRWSTVLGIPVAIPATALYAILFLNAATLRPAPPAAQSLRNSWQTMIALSALAAAAALWFLGLQAIALHRWCPYCLVVHVCGLSIFTLTAFRAPLRYPTAAAPMLLGLVGAASLVTAQVYFPASEIQIRRFTPSQSLAMPLSTDAVPHVGPPSEYPASSSTSTPSAAPSAPAYGPNPTGEFLAGRITVDRRELPVLGPLDADHWLLFLYDYTCPHCRRVHSYLESAVERFGDALAIVLAPMPLDARCNSLLEATPPIHRNACEYARLALAVWHAKPASFPLFDSWLSAAVTLPPPAAARRYASTLLGTDALNAALDDPAINARIQANINIYNAIGRGRIPKLITQNDLIIESPANLESLFEALETSLGLHPKNP